VSFVAVEKLINMYDGYRKQFVVNRQELLLVQDVGEHFILQSNCPHKHWPLINATFDQGLVTCQKHNISFNLTNGQAANIDEGNCLQLKTYAVAYEGNSLGIDTRQL
jgi:nitrite reductase/ring-hydroxylating ferredoxin subunit